MTLWLALFLMQNAQTQADRIRAAMEPSLEKQRASVRRQLESVRRVETVQIAAQPWIPAAPPELGCEPVAGPELARMIDDAAHKQSVDPTLVREVARQESGFRPCAVSSKGAQGLMQLMPATQMDFQVGDPFSPEQSLEAGSKLLKQLLERYHGDLALALSAYNAGARRVDEAGGIPEIPETKTYVTDILNRLLQ